MFRKKKKDEAQDREQPAAGFDQQQPPRNRLTPVEVQEAEFRVALFRGYKEQDVDEFLDRVTEELATLYEENKRLRERLDEGGGGPAEALRDAERRAAETVRQAREYAAKLMEDAQRAGAGGAVAASAPAGYLVRERDFLQQMASLIQGHAEKLKADAKRAKAEQAEPVPATPAPEPAREEPSVAPQAVVPEPEPDPEPEPEAPPAPPWEQATEAHDPLLEDWDAQAETEEPLGGGATGDLLGEQVEKQESGGEEPSLRELFWGEE